MACKDTRIPDLPIAEIRRVEVQPGSIAIITVGYRTTDPNLPCEVLYSGGLEKEPYLDWRCRDSCSLITLALQNKVSLNELPEFLHRPDFQPNEIEAALKVLEVAQTPPKWPEILRLSR